jgi:predicted ribosome quality control (RQC) complex YloA/Tae2 family protein
MKEQHTLEFDWFDECVDLYFTQIDKQKEDSKVQQKEAEIYKKMNRIKNDQLKRIEGLQKEQDNSLSKAKLLQNSIDEVQAIIEILNALQQSGLQWKEIWRMIKEEKRSGNPLANLISAIDLEKKSITLIFSSGEKHSEHDANEFFDDQTENLMITIDIDLSAQGNIQKYFEIKKKTQEKEERTKGKANEAIKHAEDQARKALLKTRNEQKLKTAARKPFWFEKFDWFISSENYLIISGKNAQQNEEIVKTYLGKRDIYVHSEMAGSAS